MNLEVKNERLESSQFSTLPHECLVEILRYLNTADLFNFCQAYTGCEEYLLKEKKLISKIDLSCDCTIDLEIIESKFNPEHVTSLNLNGCHWVSINGLRNFVKQLVNLKQLSALRTKLGFADKDAVVYLQTKIEKLALTLTTSFEQPNRVRIFPNITTICLELDRVNQSLYSNFIKFPNLEKVWLSLLQIDWVSQIYTEITYWIDQSNLQQLKKVYIATSEGASLFNFPGTKLERFYLGCKDFQPECACFEVLGSSKQQQGATEAFTEVPYGPKDARRLYLEEETLEAIQFEELNLRRCKFCSSRFCVQQTCKELLKSPQALHVKKLAVPNCLFGQSEEEDFPYDAFPDLKRPKIDVNAFSNFKDVTHLELYICRSQDSEVGRNEYNSVANFTQLKLLYVEVPSFIDGEFFIHVLKNCTKLETLWIESRNESDVFNTHVCKALEPSAANLKEFTLKNNRLNINNLVTAILRSNVKLRKLCLICKETDKNDVDKIDLDLFTQYLRLNPQLSHCLLQIDSFSEERAREVQRIGNRFKMRHTQLICNGPLPRSHSHVHLEFKEMREFRSSVAGINMKEDFETF